MPEEHLETHELKEQLEEARERAEHARGEHGGAKAAWTLQLEVDPEFRTRDSRS